MATDENYLRVAGTNLVAGRNFNAMDISSGENTCILGNALAHKFLILLKMLLMHLLPWAMLATVFLA